MNKAVVESEADFLPGQLTQEQSHLVDEIHDLITELQRQGVSLRTIRNALRSRQKISVLYVTSDFRIFLPDFGNIEVKLSPLNVAVYLLFLSHPQGILLKEMSAYRNELLSIYQRTSHSMNLMHQLHTIDRLLNPFDNSLHEKLSQIHHAFYSILDESLAQHYCISGVKGGKYSIPLDRIFLKID